MKDLFFWIIVGILVADFLLERILDWLNSTYWSDTLPTELVGIYDEDKYKKSQQYEKAKMKFSTVVSSLSLLAMLVMLFAGGFAWLDQWIRMITVNPILLALLFFGILMLASNILTLPFDIYNTFRLEEKFGFNLTKPKTFILDRIKGILLSILIGGGLLALVVWIYDSTGNLFWIVTWAVIAVFMIFMNMFYSNLIVPLFNKQTPLEPGALRDSIEGFAKKVGFRLKNIYVIDGSKRSKKSNAYFTGLGPQKRIVLYDTLIQNHTTEELVSVLGHEIGHYKKKHTTIGMILSLLETALMLFILSLFIRPGSPLSLALCNSLSGFSNLEVTQSFYMGVMAFGLLYSPLSLLLNMGLNRLSRKHEYAADRFAGENYNPDSLQEALKKLSVNNLSNLRPHPAYVFFYYSHPTLLQRLSALEKLKSPDPES
ncbi:MAG: M48 family metallopeptidase [Bacteroidota bacterium]|nr:M48 family metallopeptidase [Bacteroidota bacterium]